MCWRLMQSSFSAFRAVLPWRSWAIAEVICGEIFFWREFPKLVGYPGFWLLALELPSQNHQGRWPKLHGGNDTLLLKHWLTSLILALFCANSASSPGSSCDPCTTHWNLCSLFLWIAWCNCASQPTTAMWKRVPLAFKRTFQGTCSLERQHMEKHTSVCVGMGGVCVCVLLWVFFPLGYMSS